MCLASRYAPRFLLFFENWRENFRTGKKPWKKRLKLSACTSAICRTNKNKKYFRMFRGGRGLSSKQFWKASIFSKFHFFCTWHFSSTWATGYQVKSASVEVICIQISRFLKAFFTKRRLESVWRGFRIIHSCSKDIQGDSLPVAWRIPKDTRKPKEACSCLIIT